MKSLQNVESNIFLIYEFMGGFLFWRFVSLLAIIRLLTGNESDGYLSVRFA